MKLDKKLIAEQIVARLVTVTEDDRFYIYHSSDDMFKIEHPFYFESEIEQIIYNNLISNPLEQ